MLKHNELTIDLFIAGAQKAGTTSLKNYLGEHPNIANQVATEFEFFSLDNDRDIDLEIEKYFELKNTPRKIVAKHAHIYKDPRFIDKLHAYYPDCKLVFIAREPVSRLLSAYKMAVKDGWADFSIQDIIDANSEERNDKQQMLYNVFIKLGHYDLAYNNFCRYFDISQIKFFEFDQFRQNPQQVCDEIFQWIGVDRFTPNCKIKHNTSKVVRSHLVGKMISRMRRENNPIKKVIKGLLPYSRFKSLSEGIVRLNHRSENQLESREAPLVSSNEYEELRMIYASSVESFKKQSHLNIDSWEY